MAESLFLQFDKEFERLEITDKENISYWKDAHDNVKTLVDELLVERENILILEGLDGEDSEISESFPGINYQVQNKLHEKCQILEYQLYSYISKLNLQTRQIRLLCTECSLSASILPFSFRGKPSKAAENTSVGVGSSVTSIYSLTNKKTLPMLTMRAEQLQKCKCMLVRYEKVLQSLLDWVEMGLTSKTEGDIGQRLGEGE